MQHMSLKKMWLHIWKYHNSEKNCITKLLKIWSCPTEQHPGLSSTNLITTPLPQNQHPGLFVADTEQQSSRAVGQAKRLQLSYRSYLYSNSTERLNWNIFIMILNLFSWFCTLQMAVPPALPQHPAANHAPKYKGSTIPFPWPDTFSHHPGNTHYSTYLSPLSLHWKLISKKMTFSYHGSFHCKSLTRTCLFSDLIQLYFFGVF